MFSFKIQMLKSSLDKVVCVAVFHACPANNRCSITGLCLKLTASMLSVVPARYIGMSLASSVEGSSRGATWPDLKLVTFFQSGPRWQM